MRLALFAVAMLFAYASLSSLLEGVIWWFATAVVVVLPIIAIGIATQVGRRAWHPFVAGGLTALGSLTFGYARDASFFGVVPTFDTIGRWIELVNAGVLSITSQRVPAEATEGILFLLAILAVVAVVFIAPALDRVPATAALPLLVVLDIPVAVRSGVAEPLWFFPELTVVMRHGGHPWASVCVELISDLRTTQDAIHHRHTSSHRAQRVAMIAVMKTQETVLMRLCLQAPILQRHFERDFDRD